MDNTEKKISRLDAEDISGIGDGGLADEALKRIKARTLEKVRIENKKQKENLFMKKLKNYQKILVWAACFCLIVGATFGALKLAGVFDKTAPVDNPGIIGTTRSLNMIKNSASYDAEGTKYKYYVSLDINADYEAVAQSFRDAGMKASIIENGEEKIIELNATREQLISYEAPDGILMLFSVTLSDNENSDRRY